MKNMILIAALIANNPAFALITPVVSSEQMTGNQTEMIESSMTEFDPTSPYAEQMLEEYDAAVEAAGGSNWIGPKKTFLESLVQEVGGCGMGCPVVARISLGSQQMTLRTPQGSYVWAVSSGVGGRTPRWSGYPNGRIYTAHTSNIYPGGDYNGLGNMPYAVFLFGGIAIHGTPRGNWGRLGSPASHGCIRLHPSNAQYFNQLVRQYGRRNVYVSIY
jgi:lipoprotein-anchoring transpeptidase ErfK/SrfK